MRGLHVTLSLQGLTVFPAVAGNFKRMQTNLLSATESAGTYNSRCWRDMTTITLIPDKGHAVAIQLRETDQSMSVAVERYEGGSFSHVLHTTSTSACLKHMVMAVDAKFTRVTGPMRNLLRWVKGEQPLTQGEQVQLR